MTLTHGARRLARVEVVSYNVELKDEDGFLGDRASKGAFRRFIDRKPLHRIGEDPFGNEQSSKIGKKKLDDLLAKGDVESRAGGDRVLRARACHRASPFSQAYRGKTLTASCSAAGFPQPRR